MHTYRGVRRQVYPEVSEIGKVPRLVMAISSGSLQHGRLELHIAIILCLSHAHYLAIYAGYITSTTLLALKVYIHYYLFDNAVHLTAASQAIVLVPSSIQSSQRCIKRMVTLGTDTYNNRREELSGNSQQHLSCCQYWHTSSLPCRLSRVAPEAPP